MIEIYNNDNFLAQEHNITKEELLNMKILQNNKCKICGKDFTKCRRVIDHDHKTGKVRGLLCGNCNTALGMISDDINILNNMIYYLKG
jgi:hypothetical protein